MDVEIGGLRNELLGQIASAADPRALEELRVAALGKKGRVTELVKQLGTLPPEQRREAGQAFNTVKREVEEALSARRLVLEQAALDARLEAERIDVTLPARERQEGRIHPVSQAAEEIVAIFADMGFAVAEGPGHRGRLAQFRGAQHPARAPRAADASTRSTWKPSRTAGRCCCAPTPARCRSAPCWPASRRSGSSRPAAPTAATATRPTRRCSTRSRAW